MIKWRCATANPYCPVSCSTDHDISQLLSVPVATDHTHAAPLQDERCENNIELISLNPPVILLDGFQFNKHSVSSSGIYFRCKDRDCKARCKTTLAIDEVMSTSNQHNHDIVDVASNEGLLLIFVIISNVNPPL